ncbi:MAG: type II toxin-antitoxin system VapC family toxin [Planctomycetes bacterium]|nr:type II toxin-antitoxin system VapC family toxin [Planctomycetota bacterium]
MPVLLDTDHLSVLQWQEQPACDRLLERLDQLAADDMATSIVRFHEQVQGWLAYINRGRKPQQIIAAYEKLEIIWRWFLKMNVASYTSEAQLCCSQIKRQCPRIRAMDLRIASIAITTEATLLTRNLRDFRQVPGLHCEDWTA